MTKTKQPNLAQLRTAGVRLAKAYVKAAGLYVTAFREYQRKLPRLSDDRFWEIVDLFLDLWKRSASDGYGDTEHVCDEFFRLANTRENVKFSVSWQEAQRFVVTYEDWQNKLGVCLHSRLHEDNTVQFSDDSFFDMVDSFPLAGRSVAELVMGDIGNFKNFAFIKRAIAKARPGKVIQVNGRNQTRSASLVDFITDSENYVLMSLNKQAQAWFVHEVASKEINKYGNLP